MDMWSRLVLGNNCLRAARKMHMEMPILITCSLRSNLTENCPKMILHLPAVSSFYCSWKRLSLHLHILYMGGCSIYVNRGCDTAAPSPWQTPPIQVVPRDTAAWLGNIRTYDRSLIPNVCTRWSSSLKAHFWTIGNHVQRNDRSGFS